MELTAAQRVVIVTPHVDSIRNELGPAFVRWHERRFGELVEVEWRFLGGTSDALKFVQSEFTKKQAGIGIDCFFGGGQEPFLLLADKQLLQRYQPPPEVLEGIPQSINGVEVYDADFKWFGVVLSSFGILQNTRVQRVMGLTLASRWEDLAQPALSGWVGAGDPRNSGTMNVMFEAFLQYYGWQRGWEVLTQIGGNVRKFDRASSTTAKDVTLGETAYAFCIDFYAYSQLAVVGTNQLAFKAPEDFMAMNPDGIAILKGAPNAPTARRFVDFVLSEDAQKLWFLPRTHPDGPKQHTLERLSVRPKFYVRYRDARIIEFSPFELSQRFRYDARLGNDRRGVVAALAGALLVDTHRELQYAWRAVIQRGLNAADLLELGRMPITDAEALKLATGSWKDPAVRNAKKIEWQSWAQDKYHRLANGSRAAPENTSPAASKEQLSTSLSHYCAEAWQY